MYVCMYVLYPRVMKAKWTNEDGFFSCTVTSVTILMWLINVVCIYRSRKMSCRLCRLCWSLSHTSENSVIVGKRLKPIPASFSLSFGYQRRSTNNFFVYVVFVKEEKKSKREINLSRLSCIYWSHLNTKERKWKQTSNSFFDIS